MNKTIVWELKSNYKLIAAEETTLKCYAFDLQKALPVPYGEHSSYYYKCNFAVYNLTVTDLDTKQCYCYIWDQTVAKRGGNEISSCLYEHLNDVIRNTYVKHVVLFCDNCPGQNKNRIINYMLCVATVNIPNLECIDLIFLEKGYTQNVNDLNIQWETLMQMSCKSKPYHVKYLIQENMLNFNVSNTINALMFSGKPANMQGKLTKMCWSKLGHIQFVKPEFGGEQDVLMYFKYVLNVPFQEAIIGNTLRIGRFSAGHNTIEIKKSISRYT